MNADQRRFKHDDVTQRIIAVFFDVYNELGYGFLESVYKNGCVMVELKALKADQTLGVLE